MTVTSVFEKYERHWSEIFTETWKQRTKLTKQKEEIKMA